MNRWREGGSPLPPALNALADVCGLTSEWVVADIGSGTGNLAQLYMGQVKA